MLLTWLLLLLPLLFVFYLLRRMSRGAVGVTEQLPLDDRHLYGQDYRRAMRPVAAPEFTVRTCV